MQQNFVTKGERIIRKSIFAGVVLCSAILILLLLFLSVPGSCAYASNTDNYHDIDGNAWYMTEGWIPAVLENNLMTGYSSTSFGPDDPITRGQVATILFRFCNTGNTETTKPSDYAKTNTTGLIDVDENRYYTAAVNWAKSRGIITGYTAGTYKNMFLPDGQVTREELATMLTRFAKYIGADTSVYSDAKLKSIYGYEHASSWAHSSLGWCADKGVISGIKHQGESILEPQSSSTRAQMAKMITMTVRSVQKETGNEGKTYHEAITKQVWVETKPAYTTKEPVYETHAVCYCGFDYTEAARHSADDIMDIVDRHMDEDDNAFLSGEKSKRTCYGYRTGVLVIVGYKQIVNPAEGYWKTEVVKQAGWF